VTAALSAPQYLIPILVGLVLILLVRRVIGRPPSPIPLLACYLGLLAVAIFIATITRMWTPVEVVTARTGVNTSRYISHVVSQDSQWTTLLTTDDRRLVRVLSSEVVHRQICHHPTQPRGGRPLIYWILGKEYSSPNAACENICQGPERSVPPPPGATRVQATPCES
jgi:hypothetical protein